MDTIAKPDFFDIIKSKSAKMCGGAGMDFQTYIKPELLVLVPVLYIIGAMMNKSRAIDNRYIPASLGGMGILFSMLWVVGTEGATSIGVFTAITQGILAAGMAVYTNQIAKQARKGR